MRNRIPRTAPSQPAQKKRHRIHLNYGWQTASFAFMTLLIFCTAGMILISSVKATAFDQELYIDKFDKFDIWSRFDSTIDLRSEVDLLVTYLETGGREEEIMATDFYNDREKIHLVEVKDLFSSIFFLLDLAVWGSILALAGLVLTMRQHFKAVSDEEASRYIKKITGNILIGIGFIVDGIAVLSGIMGLFFGFAFHYFHVLLFKTDTWMLNPATDNLIRMFPQQFFLEMFLRIILSSAAFATVLLIAGAVILKWNIKQKKR